MYPQRQQSVFLAARDTQLILDVYLAGQLDPPDKLRDQPLAMLRLNLLMQARAMKDTGALLMQQAHTVTHLLASLLPAADANLRNKVINERLTIVRNAWAAGLGLSSRAGSSVVRGPDIASLWQSLVDKNLVSAHI